MKYRATLVFSVFILVLVVTACGGAQNTATPEPPTVTPVPILPLEDEPFRNQILGYSILYPQGWQQIEVKEIGTDFLYAPGEPIEEIMQGLVLPGVPLIVIGGGPLQTLFDGGFAGMQDALEMLDEVVAGVSENEAFRKGEVQELTVAGQAALAVDVNWVENEVEAAGRFVAIHMGDRGFVIQAVGSAEGWAALVPTWEAMLGSMAIFEPAPQYLLSEDFFGDGYFISFPVGWRVYTAEGISILAAKQEYVEEDVPSIPLVLLESGSLATLSRGQVAEAQDARQMLEAIVEAHRAQDTEYEFSEVQDVTISDEPGASISIRWQEDGTPALKRVIAVHKGDWGFLIQAVGSEAGWGHFAPVYEEMLKTVAFF